MGKAEFSKQGAYLWHLIKVAGWDKKKPGSEHARYELYAMKTFKATHINALNEDEIRRFIATMKPYAAKAKFDKCKGLRQQIVAMVAGKGLTQGSSPTEWLHTMMPGWGFGDSMRELGYDKLMELRGCVMEALGIRWAKQPGRKMENHEGTKGTKGTTA